MTCMILTSCQTYSVQFYSAGLWGQTLHCGRTASALRAHCRRTAGTCIKDHPKEEGRNVKHADAATQDNNLILRCVKSVVLIVTNPNCNYAKAYKRGTCSNDMCHTPIYLHDSEHIVDNKHHHHFPRHLQEHPVEPTQTQAHEAKVHRADT